MFMRFLISIASVFVLAGCACDDEFEYLTLGIGGDHVTTTPKWNDTWVHPGDQRFIASATWGPADPAPDENAFELWRRSRDSWVREPLDTSTCYTRESLTGACEVYRLGGSCDYRGREWIPDVPLGVQYEYRLVFRPALGNGRRLSWDGERVEFEGSEAFVMTIEVE